MIVYINEATNPYSNCLSLKTQMIVDRNVWINCVQTAEKNFTLDTLFETKDFPNS